MAYANSKGADANSKGADKPAHPRVLVRAFAVRTQHAGVS